jgi:hypothetical protein
MEYCSNEGDKQAFSIFVELNMSRERDAIHSELDKTDVA